MIESNIEMFYGEARRFDIAVTDGTAAVDISGATFALKAGKLGGTSDINVANAAFTIDSAPGGTVHVTIPASATTGLTAVGFAQLRRYEVTMTLSGSPYVIASGNLTLFPRLP